MAIGDARGLGQTLIASNAQYNMPEDGEGGEIDGSATTGRRPRGRVPPRAACRRGSGGGCLARRDDGRRPPLRREDPEAGAHQGPDARGAVHPGAVGADRAPAPGHRRRPRSRGGGRDPRHRHGSHPRRLTARRPERVEDAPRGGCPDGDVRGLRRARRRARAGGRAPRHQAGQCAPHRAVAARRPRCRAGDGLRDRLGGG